MLEEGVNANDTLRGFIHPGIISPILLGNKNGIPSGLFFPPGPWEALQENTRVTNFLVALISAINFLRVLFTSEILRN